jgi:hypothetical protein
MKVVRAAAASGLFLLVLVIVYYAHISFLRVDVVFYAAIADCVVAAMLASLALMVVPYFRIFGSFEKFQLAAIWLLAGYALAISVPTVIDRSLSFYILEKLQQRGGGIQLSAFEDVFKDEYLKEHRLVDVRLTEQLKSGTIVIEQGCVELTSKGDMLANMSRFFRRHFLPKKRLLIVDYSDDLVDPFKNTSNNRTYVCGRGART